MVLDPRVWSLRLPAFSTRSSLYHHTSLNLGARLYRATQELRSNTMETPSTTEKGLGDSRKGDFGTGLEPIVSVRQGSIVEKHDEDGQFHRSFSSHQVHVSYFVGHECTVQADRSQRLR